MNNIKTFPLDYEIIEQLFKNSKCLSYNPIEPMAAFIYAKELETELKKTHGVKRCRIVSKTAKLWQRGYNPRFHYFSDGSLIFSSYLQEKGASEALERIKTMLEIRGYKIGKIYAPQEQIDIFNYDKMLRYITEQSLIRYSFSDDLSAAPFPSKEEFVNECFYDGNILLTACKNEKIKPECRNYLALFADGRFYISNTYEKVKTANSGKIAIFELDNDEYLRLEREYVPQDYIEALYAKAAEYEWYETPVEAEQKHKLSINELTKMQKYIDNLFANRKCVSVLNPDNQNSMLTPELDKYALFSDGLLIIAQSRTHFGEDSSFIKQMHEFYQNYEFIIEQVPDYYLPEIYRRLPEFQKSATAIYVEMLKQKARKLKRITDLTHVAALDAVAQISGWKNWKAVKIEDESHARNLINRLNRSHQSALEHNPENPLMWEYEHWQTLQKHLK